MGQILFASEAESGGSNKLIRGIITTREGNPVIGAAVGIFDPAGTEIASTVTDNSGSFEITTDVPSGEYELIVANSQQLNDERITLGRTDVDIKLAVSGVAHNVPGQARFEVSSRQLGIPAKARTHVAAAQEHFNKMNLAAATKDLDIALGMDPSFSEALSMRAFVKLAAKDLPGAIEDASAASTLDPSNGEAYLALGTSYNSLKNYDRAEAALLHALDLRPGSWQAQLEIAKAWYGQRRFVLALRELKLMGRDFPDVHLVRANILMSLGRQHEGAEEFREFLREAPTDGRKQQIQRILTQLEAEGNSAQSR